MAGKIFYSPAFQDARRKIGNWICSFVDPVTQLDFINHRYYVKKARSPGARLSQAEIQRWRSYMMSVQEIESRRNYFETVDIENTFQGTFLELFDKAVETLPSLKTVGNIGVNYAYIDHLIAKRHPSIDFVGIDIMNNVAEANAHLALPNLEFMSGYALEILEEASAKFDALMMSSVAYEVKTIELQEYFNIACSKGVTFILNEPIYLMPGGRVVDPDTVPVDDAIPVYSYEGRLRREPGPLAVVHNYRGMLLKAGYDIPYYRGLSTPFY
jgi:hypothetical protein